MNNISFSNDTDQEILELEKLKGLINYAIKEEKLKKVEFSVIFTNNDYIQQLNKQYRQIDKPTDVLTFAFEDSQMIKTQYRLLGEIYISLDKASEQAEQYGHSFLRELAFLLIHGFLHMLGYDHMNQQDEEVMFKKQEEILNGYGIKREE